MLRSACLLLALSLVALGCRAERPATAPYSGTLIVGTDYVQLLATAPEDRSCPPRIQRAGHCVRTPPAVDSACASEPPCITGLTVSTDGHPTVTSTSSFAQVPWLASARPASITIAWRGCGGARSIAISPGDPMSPFAKSTARVTRNRVNLTWTPAAGAKQVCGLWRYPTGIEVCCAGEGGAASFAAPADINDVRLSRGRLIETIGALDVYRTSETRNLLE